MKKLLFVTLACLLLSGCAVAGSTGETAAPTGSPTPAIESTSRPSPTPAQTNEPTPTPLPETQAGYIDTEDGNGVRMRGTPSAAEDGNILGTLEEGTVVAIVSRRDDGWTEILRDDGSLAYVSSEYVAPGAKPEAPLHPYYIYVEKGSFTINVYGLDANNEYTVLLHAWRTGVGDGAKTPTGLFKIGKKERWRYYPSGACIPYASQFHGGLYIHGPVYSQADSAHMYNSEYNEIGTAVTSGCLRTMSYAAWWIYTYCEEGTVVEIVNGSPRGTASEDPPDIVTRNVDPTEALIREEESS